MCGASDQQKQVEALQQQFYQTQIQNAKSVFGDESSIFKELSSAFAPILAAGPNQEGFSAGEKTALNSQATEGTAINYQNANKAVAEKLGAEGGGDTFIPSGQNAQIEAGVAQSAAQQESSEHNQILANDYATGRNNYFAAAQGLTGAADVFNGASNFNNSTNNAGADASTTANEITQANNSWIGAVSGLVGGLGGAALTGGLSGGAKVPGAPGGPPISF